MIGIGMPVAPALERAEPAGVEARPRGVEEAAAQFEGLLLGQILKSMRQAASDGWLGTGDDQAGATMLEIAEEHLAQVLAAQGGLGLARMIVQNLNAPGGDSIRCEDDAHRRPEPAPCSAAGTQSPGGPGK